MTHKEILSFYRNDKEIIDELINIIYLSVYTPTLNHHDDFAEAIGLPREDAKSLFYSVMYYMNYKEDTPWIVSQYNKESKYSYNLSRFLVKEDILTKVRCEILEDQVWDVVNTSEEKCRNAKKRLQKLRAGQGNTVVPDTQA